MSAKKYVSKPVEIEAMQYKGEENAKEVVKFTLGSAYVRPCAMTCNLDLIIPTLEGNMKANVGDYVIKGLEGEFYPCKSTVFKAKYSEVLY